MQITQFPRNPLKAIQPKSLRGFGSLGPRLAATEGLTGWKQVRRSSVGLPGPSLTLRCGRHTQAAICICIWKLYLYLYFYSHIWICICIIWEVAGPPPSPLWEVDRTDTGDWCYSCANTATIHSCCLYTGTTCATYPNTNTSKDTNTKTIKNKKNKYNQWYNYCLHWHCAPYILLLELSCLFVPQPVTFLPHLTRTHVCASVWDAWARAREEWSE